MKNKKTILVFSLLSLLTLFGCSPEEDIKTPDLIPVFLREDFTSNTTDGANLNLANWTNFAEAGTVKWEQGVYFSDKYAEFTGYQSNEASNIGWLISPPVNMDLYENDKIAFQTAQAYVSSSANTLEFLVSTDFDGTNVTTATWESIPFDLAPLDFDTNFDFFDSGAIDLSSYTGTIHFAFKVKGSGTNTSLDGTWEIDNIRLYSKK